MKKEIKRFIEQSWLCFKGQKAQFELEEFILLDTLYPFFTLIFYCIVAGYSFQTTNLTRWVVGNAFLLCINTCIFSLGNSFVGERYYGRIRSMVVSPASRIGMILEKGFFCCIETAATTFVGFLMGCLVFHISFQGVPIGEILLFILISTLAATGFGLFLGVFGLVTDEMHFILNLTNYVLLIFSGAEFPIAQLPPAMRVISGMIPLTRSIEAANLLFEGKEFSDVAGLVLGELLLAGVYFLFGALVIRRVEKIAIKRATLEVF